MSTLPIGFILTIAVIYFSLGSASFGIYLNVHAVVIVFAGTITILLMSTPAVTLRRLLSATIDLLRPVQKVDQFKNEFRILTQNRSLTVPSKNELINYGAELWMSGVDSDLFTILITQKKDDLERGYIDAVQTLRNLAKYPPALGMTGTVMGLVTLFSSLGKDQSAIGPSLALAMTATFWGLIVANCVVTPLADHLHVKHIQKEKLYTNIYQILILINRGEASALIKDEVDKHVA